MERSRGGFPRQNSWAFKFSKSLIEFSYKAEKKEKKSFWCRLLHYRHRGGKGGKFSWDSPRGGREPVYSYFLKNRRGWGTA